MDQPQPSTGAPRTYRLLSPTTGLLYWVFCITMFAGDWWPILFGAKKAAPNDFIFPFLYLLLAAVYTVTAKRNFVRLSGNAIEVSRLLKSEKLPFDKIKGRRKYTERADPYGPPPSHLVLASNDGQFPRIDIRLKNGYNFDEAFYRWFESFPDLDKLDGIEPPKSKYSNFSLV